MSSLPPAANGNGGGLGGQPTGQGRSHPHVGTALQTSLQTVHYSAINVDMNVTHWKKKGVTVPSHDARIKDVVSFLTKHVAEVKLAPLPHGGHELLPCIGRAEKTANDIHSIPKEDWQTTANILGRSHIQPVICRNFLSTRATLSSVRSALALEAISRHLRLHFALPSRPLLIPWASL